MFGSYYYRLDALLAGGKASQAEYAGEIIAVLVNRAHALRLLRERHMAGSEVDEDHYEHAIGMYLEDVEEARARALRAGLCHDRGYHTVYTDGKALDDADGTYTLGEVGGLLVREEGE
jgi:hypothetical protein